MTTKQDPVPNKAKREPKGEIKYRITLNDEQKVAKTTIYESPVTVLKGAAGSGKTLVACAVALDMFFKRKIEKIIICRPAISKEDIGFLPGSADDKLAPYLQPVVDNFYKVYDKVAVDKLIKDGVIQIIPFAFMRGHTFTSSFIIVDEAQNLYSNMMELVLGRLGLESKMVICGDVSQIDLKQKKDSGFIFLTTLEKEVEGFKVVELRSNHRHPIVEKILQVYKKYE